MGLRSRARELLKKALQRPEAPPAVPREPPPFVPNPADEGLETSPADLLRRRADGEQFVFVDVRATNERDTRIPGALHVYTGELTARWGEVEDLGGTPVCYCASGGQSINAASLLRERGMSAATSILGGLPAWEDAGGDTEQVD